MPHAVLIIVCGLLIVAVLIMMSLLCLRFMNSILDWGDKQTDYATHILNGNYQRVDNDKNEKSKQPQAAITIHTIQPYGKMMRDEETDVPYTEDSDMEIEYINPIQRLSSKENLGKLYFSFHYSTSSKLIVKLLKADELPEAKDDNPRIYVTASFVHNVDKTSQEFKSNVQQGTYCPNFNETFEFNACSTVQEQNLRFIVWYVDSFSQGECLGMVEYSLEKQEEISSSLDDNEENVICREIQRITRSFQDIHKNSMYDHGTVLLSLTYTHTTQRLTVVLFKAQNLSLTSDDNQGIYAEVTILYMRKSRRKRKVTRSMSGTNSPVYNEAILFDLTDLKIEDMKLQITLKQKRTDKPDMALGRVLMGNNVNDSEAKLHWNNAMNAKKAVAQWHSLRRCVSYNWANRRRLRARLSCSDAEMLTDSSSSGED